MIRTTFRMETVMKMKSTFNRSLQVALLTSSLVLSLSAVAASPQESETHSTLQHVTNTLDHAAITAQVKAALIADQRTHAFDINVDTDGNGQVTLAGTAPSQEASRAAVDVARNVNGVTAVHNELAVTSNHRENPQTLTSKAAIVGEDGWMTTKVKAALADDDRVSAFDVSVHSRGSEIMLSGQVPDETARQAAIQRAREVTGVSHVDAHDLTVGSQQQ